MEQPHHDSSVHHHIKSATSLPHNEVGRPLGGTSRPVARPRGLEMDFIPIYEEGRDGLLSPTNRTSSLFLEQSAPTSRRPSIPETDHSVSTLSKDAAAPDTLAQTTSGRFYAPTLASSQRTKPVPDPVSQQARELEQREARKVPERDLAKIRRTFNTFCPDGGSGAASVGPGPGATSSSTLTRSSKASSVSSTPGRGLRGPPSLRWEKSTVAMDHVRLADVEQCLTACLQEICPPLEEESSGRSFAFGTSIAASSCVNLEEATSTTRATASTTSQSKGALGARNTLSASRISPYFLIAGVARAGVRCVGGDGEGMDFDTFCSLVEEARFLLQCWYKIPQADHSCSRADHQFARSGMGTGGASTTWCANFFNKSAEGTSFFLERSDEDELQMQDCSTGTSTPAAFHHQLVATARGAPSQRQRRDRVNVRSGDSADTQVRSTQLSSKSSETYNSTGQSPEPRRRRLAASASSTPGGGFHLGGSARQLAPLSVSPSKEKAAYQNRGRGKDAGGVHKTLTLLETEDRKK
ncbi:unnamed protein product [Amoebophrya sp. A25]|nr:unnamed protein product [Amoebophrya sp. A25]|eukprot:GSA25T00026706001.1